MKQQDRGASASQTGLSQVEPVPVSPADATSIPSADEARRLSNAARDNWGAVQSSYSEALAAVRAEWEPKVLAARGAYNRAHALMERAVAAETPDHELHGQPVFRIEKITERWSRKVIGENRIPGVIETYRPGMDMGRGYGAATGLAPGDPYVRLLKKDGKPGTKTQRYQEHWGGDNPWKLASAMSAGTAETPQEAQGDAQPKEPSHGL